MKRKLFLTAFWFALGAFSPNLKEYATEWWNAPPTPPSAEAAQLIASLQSAEGWEISSEYKYPCKGDVVVSPSHLFFADIYISKANCSNQFSWNDRKLINQAADSCMRKITAKGLEQSTKTKEVSK